MIGLGRWWDDILKVDPLWKRGASKNPVEEIRRALDNSKHGLKAEYEEITYIPPRDREP